MSQPEAAASQQRTVLMVANVFHASPRIPGIARYLPAFGWRPILLTVPMAGMEGQFGAPPADLKQYCRVIETAAYRTRVDTVERVAVGIRDRFYVANPLWNAVRAVYRAANRLYRRLYRLYYQVRWYPDEDKDWVPLAVAAGRELMQHERVDAIISSSSPVSCHLAARALKAEFGIPWVADLRDPWTQNHNYPFSRLRKVFERRLEQRTLRDADHLVTVSRAWAKRLGELLGTTGCTAVYNGFDDKLLALPHPPFPAVFRVIYTGQIYPGNQDFGKILSVLAQLLGEGRIAVGRFALEFYGRRSPELEAAVARLGLAEVVFQRGVVPREESANLQRASHLLLLLNWEDPVEKGVHPLKVFEYLAAQRPILATGGHGGDGIEDILKITGAGAYCRSVVEIAATLQEAYASFLTSGEVAYSGNLQEIRKYSYGAAAGQFASILQTVSEA